jgi:hypothetical protein
VRRRSASVWESGFIVVASYTRVRQKDGTIFLV